MFNTLMLAYNMTYRDRIHHVIANAEQIKPEKGKKIYVLYSSMPLEFGSARTPWEAELTEVYGDDSYKNTYRFFNPVSFQKRVKKWELSGINPYEQMENSVVIIDEAYISGPIHMDLKPQIYGLMHDLARNTNNLKIVLVTSSVKDKKNNDIYKFSHPCQIIYLLNILRENDKKPLIDIKDMVSWDGGINFSPMFSLHFKENYQQYFYNMTMGYVSLLNGSLWKQTYLTLGLGCNAPVLAAINWALYRDKTYEFPGPRHKVIRQCTNISEWERLLMVSANQNNI